MIRQENANASCDEIAATRRPLDRARHLPGRIYAAEEIYEQEKREIFLKDWLCVGRVEEASDPGSYFTFDVLGEPILISRGADSVLRGFFNTCAHRGVTVATESGAAKAFSCPYHGWTYGLDGRLLHAPHMEGVPGFDPAQCGLRPVRLDTWQGWVFVNLGDEPADLTDFLGTAAERLAFVHAEDCRLANKWTFELPCNWKLGVENFQDVYHLRVLHADTFGSAVDVDNYVPELLERGNFFTFHQGAPLTPTGETLFAGLPCWAGQPPSSSCIAHISPNIMLFCRYDSVFIWICWPLGPNRTQITFYTTFHKTHFDDPDFARKAKVYADFEQIIASEDQAMISALQRAMTSNAYRAGRMSPYEHTIHHMMNHYLDRMGLIDDGRI